MALQALPAFIQGGTHPAEIARNAFASILGVPDGSHTAGVSVMTAGGGHGVVGTDDMKVTQLGTPAMKVNVAAGAAVVRAGGVRIKGVYPTFNDATVEVTIANADPTNPRIDLIILHTPDTNYGDGSDVPVFVAVAGTPAGSPAVPSLAAYPNCLVLAQVAVAAAATTIVTANITDKRTYVYAAGGKAYGSATVRPSGASLRQGLGLSEIDTFEELIYYSAAGVWRRPWRMPWGRVAHSTGGDVTSSGTTVLALTTGATFTGIANRYYRATFTGTHLMSVLDDLFNFQIQHDTIGGAQVAGSTQRISCQRASAQVAFSVTSEPFTVSAGSRTLLVTVLRAAGTGTCRTGFYAPTNLVIEDIGPSNATTPA